MKTSGGIRLEDLGYWVVISKKLTVRFCPACSWVSWMITKPQKNKTMHIKGCPGCPWVECWRTKPKNWRTLHFCWKHMILLGCPRKFNIGSKVRISGLFHPNISAVIPRWNNPFTNHLLTHWDILVPQIGIWISPNVWTFHLWKMWWQKTSWHDSCVSWMKSVEKRCQMLLENLPTSDNKKRLKKTKKNKSWGLNHPSRNPGVENKIRQL